MAKRKLQDTDRFKVLQFIGEAGDAGRTFSEIQKFIVVELRGLNWDDTDDWYFRDRDPQHRISRPVRRRWRGYWCDNLLGSMYPYGHQGLLKTYCQKHFGKWILTEDINSRDNLSTGYEDKRAKTKTWLARERPSNPNTNYPRNMR